MTGSHLLHVKATLRDYYEDINGNLPHTKSTHFRIHHTNGEISLIKPLDYEKVKRHKLMVRASTGNGDSAICYVYVEVVNVNDNIPLFDSSIYRLNIAEDVRVGESIIRVSARDADDVGGDAVKYSIVEGNKKLFSVDEESGWVKVNGALDRETKESHTLKIIARDVDNRKAICTVLIYLVDINDCPPVFNTSRLVLHVKEDELVGQTIGRVVAKDEDSTSNIQYFIKSTRFIIFAININTGDISLMRKLSKQSYALVVMAYDGVHTSQVCHFS